MTKDDNNLVEVVLNRNSIYEGKIIDVDVLDVTLPNGQESIREVVYHGGAVGIIAVYEGEMFFVKQYRIATEESLIEIPAGKIEPNDSPEHTAVKELKEETGLLAQEVKKLYEFYVSPGFTSEIIHLFEAKNLSMESQQLDDDEFVEIIKIPVSELKNKLKENYFRDAKTIAAVQYVISYY